MLCSSEKQRLCFHDKLCLQLPWKHPPPWPSLQAHTRNHGREITMITMYLQITTKHKSILHKPLRTSCRKKQKTSLPLSSSVTLHHYPHPAPTMQQTDRQWDGPRYRIMCECFVRGGLVCLICVCGMLDMCLTWVRVCGWVWTIYIYIYVWLVWNTVYVILVKKLED